MESKIAWNETLNKIKFYLLFGKRTQIYTTCLVSVVLLGYMIVVLREGDRRFRFKVTGFWTGRIAGLGHAETNDETARPKKGRTLRALRRLKRVG